MFSMQLPDCFDNRRQAVAAQMGTVFVENRGLSLAFREQFQNAVDIRPAAATGELAVAEGSGAPFAEQVVALRMKFAA